MNRSLLLARERALVVEALVVEALVVERERGLDARRGFEKLESAPPQVRHRRDAPQHLSEHDAAAVQPVKTPHERVPRVVRAVVRELDAMGDVVPVVQRLDALVNPPRIGARERFETLVESVQDGLHVRLR